MPVSAANDWDYVLCNVNAATMAEGCGDYGAIMNAAIAVKGERIAWVGGADEARARAAGRRIPVRERDGLWVTPGLIDCHTHLVFAGTRAQEFEQRLNGATYEQISRAGGGIQSTVNATRSASDEDLLRASMIRARRLMSEGVTAIEVKSGYGLDLTNEVRMLRAARKLESELPVTIKTTYLGLHALPLEFRDRREQFVDLVTGPWLDTVAADKLADAVDAFCESIAFTTAETGAFLARARSLGLGVHLHAGQLSDMGAAQLAARYSALSADHLEYVDDAGVDALAQAGSVAVMLPGAYFTLRQDHPPPVAALRRRGVPMAVATDCNPGTSPCTSLLLAMNMACTLFGLTPAEALAGATRHAARALGILANQGTIEAGKYADLALWRIERPAELSYGLGANPCAEVIHRGRLRES
jgi:imidazolonepropionase